MIYKKYNMRIGSCQLIFQYVFLILATLILCSSTIFAEETHSLSKTVTMLRKGKPIKIVCFGDSVTGVYYHTGNRRAYADIVEAALGRLYPQASITMINAGISGNNTYAGLNRIKNDVLKYKPQLVIVMFGLNDMAPPCTPIKNYKANLIKIIQLSKAVGAEVVLCTPNSINQTPRRPIQRLRQYVEAVRNVGRSERVPVADCYEAFEKIRAKDKKSWALLMSDGEIHPNMLGHKIIAGEILHAIIGRSIQFDKQYLPWQPSISNTLHLLEEGKPVHIIAMPPYDKLFPQLLKKIYPFSDVRVTTWPVRGKTLLEIKEFLIKKRGEEWWKGDMGVDLVLLAIPETATAKTELEYIKTYSDILNMSMVYKPDKCRPYWETLAILPSLNNPCLIKAQSDKLAHQIIQGKDWGMIKRQNNDARSTSEILETWLSNQIKKYNLDMKEKNK